jgi:hypothetical protein
MYSQLSPLPRHRRILRYVLTITSPSQAQEDIKVCTRNNLPFQGTGGFKVCTHNNLPFPGAGGY